MFDILSEIGLETVAYIESFENVDTEAEIKTDLESLGSIVFAIHIVFVEERYFIIMIAFAFVLADEVELEVWTDERDDSKVVAIGKSKFVSDINRNSDAHESVFIGIVGANIIDFILVV